VRRLLLFFLLLFLVGANVGFLLNLKNLPDANYPLILIVINIDLLVLAVVSAVILRKLIKVYLGRSQHKLRRKIANILIFYIFIPLLALNLFFALLIFQTTREFLSGKVRELSKQASSLYAQLEDYRVRNVYQKRELLMRLPEEELGSLPFVKEVLKRPCGYEITETPSSYLLCLGDKVVVMEKDTQLEKSVKRFGSVALDVRSLMKARDIITGVYVFLIVILGFLTLLATVWLSVLFARHVSQPVEELTEKALEIAKGNLKVPVEVRRRGDELEKLARAFKEMRDNLRKLYESLSEEKESLRRLLDALPVAVLFRKKTGDIFVNRTFVSMFGKPEDVETFLENVKKEKNIRTQRVERQEGDIYIFEDITPIVMAERFRVWQEAVRRIAHEIKNPLTPIKLNLGRILLNLERNPEPEKIKQLVESVMREVDRINNLVSQFKHLSTERSVKPEKLSLSELLEELAPLYRGAGLEVQVRGDALVLGDKNLLKEVFYNLINNSLEHGARRVVVEISPGKLTYRDDGKGLSEEDAKHIFEPFFSKNPKGFGIGMSIVRKIIKEHGWDVRVHPSRGGFFLEIDFKSRKESA